MDDYLLKGLYHIDSYENNSIIKQLQTLIIQGRKFIDEDFPPYASSLFGSQTKRTLQSVRVQWKSLQQIMPDSKIFVNRIQPKDVVHGQLNNCYFLAVLAALAQKSQRIYRLFLIKQVNKANFYAVRILLKGVWIIIKLDDFIPTRDNKLIFVRSVQNQLWAILLQKAYAKLFGSYQNLNFGFFEEPFHDLTSAPVRSIILSAHTIKQRRQKIWQYLQSISIFEYPIVVGGSQNLLQDSKRQYSTYAYTLIDVWTIKTTNKIHKLVKLRNNIGCQSITNNLKGVWRLNDVIWDQVLEEEKNRIGFPDNFTQTIFMDFDEIFNQFSLMTICEYDQIANYQFATATIDIPDKQHAYFILTAQDQGIYNFNLQKTPDRLYSDTFIFQHNLQRAPYGVQSKIQIVDIETGRKIEPIETQFKTLFINYQNNKCRTQYSQYLLAKGKYIIQAYIELSNPYEPNEIIIGIYAPLKYIFYSIDKNNNEMKTYENFFTDLLINQNQQQKFIMNQQTSIQLPIVDDSFKDYFQDERFPHNALSIIDNQQIAKPEIRFILQNIRWSRINDLSRDYQIFRTNIRATNMKESKLLNNSYMLAAIAAIANQPSRIRRLFHTLKKQPQLLYIISILINGIPKKIHLDDWIPLFKQQLAFVSGRQHQMWVILLEKAYAKIYENYFRLDGGDSGEILHDLTQAPVQILKNQYIKQKPRQTYQYLNYAIQNKFPIVATFVTKQKNCINICYPLIDIIIVTEYVNNNKRLHKLAVLRNHLRSQQNKIYLIGIKDKQDIFWARIQQQDKYEIQYFNKNNQNIIFIDYDRFIQQVSIIQIAQVNDLSIYRWKVLNAKQNQNKFFLFQVAAYGQYNISVEKKSLKMYPQSVWIQRDIIEDDRYSIIKFQLFRQANRYYQIVPAKTCISPSSVKTLYIKLILNPGNYVFRITCLKYPHELQKRQIVVGAYSVQNCRLLDFNKYFFRQTTINNSLELLT